MTANVIIKQVLLRRGNTANTSIYVGPIGEAVVDTDLKTLRVQDGLTPGGTLLAKADDISSTLTEIATINSDIAAINSSISSLTSNAAYQAQSISSLQTSTISLGNAVITSNSGMKSYVDAKISQTNANITAANLAIANLWANAASQDYHINVLYGNAAAQHYNLLNLNSNATVQAEQIDYLFDNAASQADRITALESVDIYQDGFLDSLLANSAAQGHEIESLWANAAAQSQSLNVITGDTTAIWANSAIQENEISGLRANIIAANAVIVGRTGEITFSGRTIDANVIGGISGIDFAPEVRFASFVGFNNTDPQHWVDIGDGLSENPGQNTGSLGIGFNNGIDTLQGHAILTWDWWDTSIGDGSHLGEGTTHSRLVIIENDNFDNPYISFDRATANVVVGNITTNIINSSVGHFSGNTYSSYVVFNNDVRYANGTPYMSGISARLDAANLATSSADSILSSRIDAANVAMSTAVSGAITTANSYTDTKISNLVNGAPAALDTLYEIANSLSNNASLSTTVLNLIGTVNSNVSAANLDIAALYSNAGVQGAQIDNLFSNAVAQGNQITYLWTNATIQNTEIADLRSNITAANTAIINNLAYTNLINSYVVANVNAANSAIITANVAMKGYVDDHIDLALGNLEINDTTITTKVGAPVQTLILDAGGDIVLKDYTGIRNPNPGYWLHIGDALDTSGIAHNGYFAIDYSDGLGNGSGDPGSEALGQRGSVVFDYLWWSNVGGGHGNYNVNGGPSRRFGLLNDGEYPQYANQEFVPYFTVDLDTKIFRVNALQSGTSILAGNIYSTGNIHADGEYTGNVRTDGYFFANGAPLVIPPLVKTGNTAPTAQDGATEGALWWNNEDGRAYIKYSENWVELSPTVLPPISRYVGNVVFYNHNISNVGTITPHTTISYNLGSNALRWKEFYIDTIDATGNVDLGSNLNVSADVDVDGNVNVITDVNVSTNVNVGVDVNVNSNVNVVADVNIDGNLYARGSLADLGNVYPHATDTYDIGSTDLRWKDLYVGTIDTTGNVSIGGNLFVYGNVTEVASTSLIIDDSLIYMANNNPGNSIDIGVVGNFNNGTYQHTGFVRDASDNTWKLFSNVVAEPTNTIDFTDAVYDDIKVGNIASPTVIDLYANIITANTNMNSRVTDLNSQMTANITATNAAIVTANTATNNRLTDVNSAMVANITATNAAIVTANTSVVNFVNDSNVAMQNYVDYKDNVLVSYITAANADIVTANTGVVNYINDQTAGLRANITAANAAIVTANAAVVSYVNNQTSGLRANITAANAAIVTANTALKNYTDTQLGTKANAASPTFTGTTTIATLSVSGNATISQNAVVQGNLQVQGTTTTINQTSLTLTDKFITMANGSPNASAANNSGLFVYGANANVLYKSANDSWTFNKPLYFDSNVVWHAGNDGAGSGLDADLLDGINSTSFVQVGTTATGVIVPSIGSGSAGIIWPTLVDGDYAYIKYYDASYDETTLEIGVYCDDPGTDPGLGDNIKLSANTITVAGNLVVTGSFSPSGAVRPTAGSGTTDGIVFPDNPGGGSGDTASIKYYSVSGEQSQLEIKVTNDSNDNIVLNATGAVQITKDLQIGAGVKEAFTTKTGATGTVDHDCSTGTIFYHTSPAANFTVNATNLRCDAGFTTSITVIISQGSTPYVPTAFQIASTAQTINWFGGSVPTGNANKKDIVSFSILNSSGTYVVLGQLVSFG